KMRAPRQAKQQSDRCVGDIFGSVIRYVGNSNPLFASGGVIDIVHAHSTTDDQLAVVQAVDGLGAHTQEMIDHEAGGVLDLTVEVLLGSSANGFNRGEFSEDPFFNVQAAVNEVSDIDAGR